MLAKAIDSENEQEVQYAILAALGRVATPEAVQNCRGGGGGERPVRVAQEHSACASPPSCARRGAHARRARRAPLARDDKDQDVKEAAAKTLLLLRGTAA